MGKSPVKIILATVVISAVLFLFVRFLERQSLYFPLRGIEATPDNIGLVYEEVTVSTSDGIDISGWYIPSDFPRATILFSHGNGGNISHRLEKIRLLNGLKLNILIFDYRGYGMSKGSPTEEGLYLDGEAMLNYLVGVKGVSAGEVIGYGESLGGAVVVDLAGKRDLGGLILEGSFTSIKDMAGHYFPFIPSFVYKTSFDSLSKIKGITVPKLHFHSSGDDVVPYRLGRKLFEGAAEPKKFSQLQGGHNDSFYASRDIYLSVIDSFVDTLKKYHESDKPTETTEED